MPNEWQFKTSLKVRVNDLNYGNHMANQQFLAFAQEARVAYFASLGYTELDFGGVSLIQADAAVTYQGEGHLGDEVQIEIAMEQSGNSSFNVFYKFTNLTKHKAMAEIRTAIICFDYEIGKPVGLPKAVIAAGVFTN